MTSEWAIALTAFVVGLSGAMMPGSLLVVNIQETMRRGLGAWPLVVGGHAALELLMVLALVLGLGAILNDPVIAGILGIGGGLVLGWFGWNTLRACLGGEISLSSALRTEAAAPGRGPLLAGAVATLSNPYWFLWWAGIGAGYVALALRTGPAGVGAFYVGHISADFLWYGLVSLLTVGGLRLVSDRLYRSVLAACGLFIIALAGYFVYTGYRLLG